MQGKKYIYKPCKVLNAFQENCRRVDRGNLSNFLSLEEVTDEHESLVLSVCK